MSSVSVATNSSTTNSCTSLSIKRGGSQGSSVSGFGSQDQASSRAKHDILFHVDASLNTGGLVGSQGGHICGVTDQSLLDGKSAPCLHSHGVFFTMSRTVPSSLGAESQAMSVALGFIEWATLFAGADSRFVRFAWCSSGKTRKTSSVCYRLHESVRSFAGSLEPNNVAR